MTSGPLVDYFLEKHSASSVQAVPASEGVPTDLPKLLPGDAIAPVSPAVSGTVDAGILAVKEKVLNGQDQKPRVAREHGS